jgi:hypothetical protein
MRVSIFVWCSFFLAALPTNIGALVAAGQSADDQFGALLHDAWEFRMREDPLFATETGDHRYDDRLPTVSLANEKRYNVAQRTFMERL